MPSKSTVINVPISASLNKKPSEYAVLHIVECIVNVLRYVVLTTLLYYNSPHVFVFNNLLVILFHFCISFVF